MGRGKGTTGQLGEGGGGGGGSMAPFFMRKAGIDDDDSYSFNIWMCSG